MAFWKPGQKKPDAPLSLEVDRESGEAGVLVTFNKNDSLGLLLQRQRLPIFKVRDPILFLIETRATVVVVGATGCGKTTQIPQYLHEAGWTDGGRQVVCTQPRRVAAQTVALRVAEEMGCRLGAEVGYSIRFEDVSSAGATRIKYVTDGTLIRELMEDPLLTKYSVVMVDEAHERSLATDVLLGLLKKVQKVRRDLRLVIASATIEAEAVAAFFDSRTDRSAPEPLGGGDAPARQPALVSVEGRTWPVSLHYAAAPVADYVRAAVEAALEIDATEGPGDILIFLTGEEEIERCVGMLHDAAADGAGVGAKGLRGRGGAPRLAAYPLYAGLPPAQQLQAFTAAPRGLRKVVVSSNVAETSVTIEGVVFVIDCCFAKSKFYDPLRAVEALAVVPAGRAACSQRAGRAGRLRPGKCYRLCSEAHFLAMAAAAVPEMQRSELTGTLLQLKALGVDNFLSFEWLAPPPSEMVVRALEVLYSLGALDDAARLTVPTGAMLAELPVEPQLGRALLCSGELGCSEELLTVAACLQVQSIWVSSRGNRKAFDEVRERFAVAEGDHVTWLNVMHAYTKAAPSGGSGSAARAAWCQRNWLSSRALARVADVRQQLASHLRRCGVPLKSAGRDSVPVRKALTAGFFAQAAVLAPFGGGPNGDEYRSLRGGAVLRIHPGSVLFRCRPAAVLYNSAVQTERLYMRDVAAIEEVWLPEHFYETKPVRSAAS